ncbi:prenyltransferase/squalene oxidase repeat-containing protein [Fictibacillus iocasae]|uniref:Prenyltransferase/squalene oxidase repeat-containing protein n=1 Tax=Fictibacillus iocasae TaxID=2715437 RepID=A0ABW2NQ97_9BACL
MDWFDSIVTNVRQRCSHLLSLQAADGSWRFCFENTLMTDAYMIILLRSLDCEDNGLISQLSDRLMKLQEKDGTWKAYPDQRGGHLTSTIEAYTALLYSGNVQKDSIKMKKAAHYIRENSGLKRMGLLSKVFFACNGLYPWPEQEINTSMLFRLFSALNVDFFDFSSYARSHFSPALLAMSRKFTITSKWTPSLSHLNPIDDSMFWEDVKIDGLNTADSQISGGDEFLIKYILNRIEVDGTLLSYASTTFLMIYGLMAIGYKKDSPEIKQALQGLSSLACMTDDGLHIQNSPSAVWDTSLVNYALLSAGISPSHPKLLKSYHYLTKKQHTKCGDWQVHNQFAAPGGWGFSDSNSIHPDIDDTQAALRTMKYYSSSSKWAYQSYSLGKEWLLSMQNNDGGWAAFEKNTNKKWLKLLPIENAEDALTDPSSADLTGRTLEYLGSYEKMNGNFPAVQQAVSWLRRSQKLDGSWYGRWGICFIYGTWAAVTGMRSVGVPPQDRCIKRSVKWLLERQNADGGWGESCLSDEKKHYVPLYKSTLTQTAWALDTLISVFPYPTEQIKKGMDYLLDPLSDTDFSRTYPTGAGLPGSFYIYYHSYPHIWPLLALSHFYKEYR